MEKFNLKDLHLSNTASTKLLPSPSRHFVSEQNAPPPPLPDCRQQLSVGERVRPQLATPQTSSPRQLASSVHVSASDGNFVLLFFNPFPWKLYFVDFHLGVSHVYPLFCLIWAGMAAQVACENYETTTPLMRARDRL